MLTDPLRGPAAFGRLPSAISKLTFTKMEVF